MLGDVDETHIERLRAGLPEFDTALGGGIVPASVTLIGGPPGAGKSTLLLQIAARLCPYGPVAYVCGEESAAQVKLRATRLGIDAPIALFAQTNLRTILDRLETRPPRVLIVDSIQTTWLPSSESYAGSLGQVRDCTQALVEFSKRTGCATFIVGHVTKDGSIAGDVRILRAYKNRFGSIDEICVFAMRANGLEEISNPSALFLRSRRNDAPGSCVVASIVGSRPVLVEVQALVGEAAYGTPRRLANNIDQQRLAMIIAVLERRAGLHLGSHDVYASVAGGLRVTEPAADLGIALAIASSFRNRSLGSEAAAFGELGLSGEVRTVTGADRRTAEARRLGYTTIFSPDGVRDVADAIDRAIG
jgi:DNA repair protein RadA/Sms